MYKTILVPLDGSERAEVVLPYAESLAKNFAARLVLVGVIEPLLIAHTSIYQNPLFDQEHLQSQIKAMESYLAGQQQRLATAGLAAHYRIAVGQVIDEISEIANQEQADLIAMTSHGRTGLAHVFYGSVAAGILHRIDRPLLLIRSLEQPDP
jgi:nucleotide-binding universal stress UspA family protein